jgi:ABC-type bacteriocin/lantibiotic exporter with double-glycine peptidase domain
LNGLTTEYIAILIEAIVGLMIALVLSLIYSWRIALVGIGMAPLLILGGIVMSRLTFKMKASKNYG